METTLLNQSPNRLNLTNRLRSIVLNAKTTIVLPVMALILIVFASGANAQTISYAAGTKTYPIGSAITPLTPTSTGVGARAYTLSGSRIGTATTMGYPQSVTVLQDGTIFVANWYLFDAPSSKISKLKPSAISATAVTAGTITSWGAGGYANPMYIASDANYVYTGDDNKIVRTSITDKTNIFTYNLSESPRGIALDKSGNIYFTGGYNIIRVLAGTTTEEIVGRPEDLNSLGTIAIDNDGFIYVTDNASNRVFKMNTDLSVIAIYTGFGFPNSLAFDNGGNLIISDETTIRSIKQNSPSGTAPITLATLAGANFAGVGVDGNGIIYTADDRTRMLKWLYPKGGYYITPALPKGLLFDSETGTISGTPLVGTPATTYTIAAYSTTSVRATATVTIKTVTSDAGLARVSTNAGATPVLDADNINYNATIVSPSVIVTPTGIDGNSTISINGITTNSGIASASIPLALGNNAIPVIVTAGDGVTTRNYTFNFNRIPGLTALTLSSGAYSPVFNQLTNTYTATVGSAVTSLNITPTAADPTLVITVAGSTVASGAASGVISLNPGNNAITIEVAETAGSPNKQTYTINVFRKLAPAFSYDNTLHTYSAGSAITAITPLSSAGIAAPAHNPVKTELLTVTQPTAITTDNAGNVYYTRILTSSTASLHRYPTGDFVAYGTGLKTPQNMKTDAVGNIYVADNGFFAVQKIDPITNTQTSLGYGITAPQGLAIDAQGNVYVAELQSGLVKKIPAGNGAPVIIAKNLSYIADLALDAEGNLFILQLTQLKVRKLPAGTVIPDGGIDGTTLEVITTVTEPVSISIDGAGNKFIGDYGTQTVSKITPAGVKIPVGATYSGMFSTTADNAGNVYVSDVNANRLYKIKPLGGYYISPALPAGLKFDSNTGIISGTPTAGSKATTYTITGYNDEGAFSTSTVNIKTVTADADLAGIGLSTGSLSTAFNAATFTYSSYTGLANISILAYANDAGATLTINGTTATSGIPFPVTLSGGDNTFDIIVTSSGDASQTKTYTLTLKKLMLSYNSTQSFNTGLAITPIVPASTNINTFGYSGLIDLAHGLTLPSGIAVGSTGDLYATNNVGTTSSRVYRITLAGTQSTLSGSYTNPYNIWLDAQNNYFVADGTKNPGIIKNGTDVSGITGSAYSGVTDLKGNIYYNPIAGGIKKLPVGTTTPVDFATAGRSVMTTDAYNNIYVVDKDNNKILKYSPEGVSTELLSGGVSGATGVSRDFSGNLYIANTTSVMMLPNGGSALVNIVPSVTFSGAYGAATENITNNVYITDNVTKFLKRIQPLGGYYISPELPEGMIFDSYTGTISGTPTAGTKLTTYTVKAYNVESNVSATFTLKTNTNIAALANLTASAGTLSPVFDTNTIAYSLGTIANSSITLTPTTTDASATVTINTVAVNPGSASAPIPLTIGENTLTIVVTSGDGTTTKTYTLTVTRAFGLDNLAVGSGTLTPSFTYTTIDYLVIVPNATASITITPTFGSDITGTVKGVAATSGTASSAIPLTVGDNFIDIVITAADLSVKTYRVNVIRKATQTITFVYSGNKPTGEPDASPATASSGLPITYTTSTSTRVSIVNGKFHLYQTGSGSVTAAQSGNNYYEAATSVTQTFTITKGTAVITFPASTLTFGDADFTPLATSTNIGTALTFTSGNTAIATIVSGKIHILKAGAVTITAAQIGNTYYTLPTPVAQTITINKAPAVNQVTLANIPTAEYGTLDFNPGATSANTIIPITYSSSNTSVATIVDGKIHITGVGTTDITATQAAADENHLASEATAPFTVTAATPVLTLASFSAKTVSSADFSPVANSANTFDAITFSSSDHAVATIVDNKIHITGAGTTTITASQTSTNSNYLSAQNTTQTLTVTKDLAIISLSPIAKTYGNADFVPDATSTNTASTFTYSSNNTNVATIVDGKIHIVGAGTAVITAAQAENDNYLETSSTAQLTVDKAVVTIIPNLNQSKVYGTADPADGYTYSTTGLVTGDEIEGLLGRTAGENVGSYSYTQGTINVVNSTNYTFTLSPETFAVTPAALIVTPTANQLKVYGTNDPALGFGYSVTGLIEGDELTGQLSRITGDNVGTYAYLLNTLTPNQPANYSLSLATGSFAIVPAQLTITPTPGQTKVYGTDDPALGFAYHVTGLIDGDEVTGQLSRIAGNDVGTYNYTIGDVTANNPANYTIALTAGNSFQIIPATLTITANAGQSKIYGEDDPALTYTTAGLAYSDEVIGDLSRDTGKDAGLYAINQGTLTASTNYSLVFVSKNFEISKAQILVTPNNATRIYGEANPAFTATYAPFISGDSEASFAELPSFSTDATLTSAAGNYVITATGGTSNNYSFVYHTGTLTVETPVAFANLSNLTASGITIDFDPSTLSYAAAVERSVTSITVTPTIFKAGATVKIRINNGDYTVVTSGNASDQLSLNPGVNTINVLVTSEDATVSKTYILTIDRTKNATSTLSALSLGTGTLNPVFSTATESYTATVANSVTSVQLTPTATDAYATIKVNGAAVTSGMPYTVALTAGANPVNVEVTAENGTTKTYTVNITRALSTNAKLSFILTPSSALTITTGTGTVNYTTSVASNVSSVVLKVIADEPGTTLKVNGTTIASGASTAPIALSVGTTMVNVVGTAQDGVTIRTYTLKIVKTGSSNAKLSLSLSPGATLTTITGPGAVNYSANVAASVNSVMVRAVADEPNTTITVNGVTVASGVLSGAIPLTGASTLITVVGTAEDGTSTRTYTLTVNRTVSGNAKLSLSINPASELTTVAGAGAVNYAASVAGNVSAITVTPVADEPNATITVNGVAVASGTPSAAINLNMGTTLITVIGTAQDGTTRTYTLTITRTGSSNAKLSLTLNPNAELTQVTGNATVNYSTNVANSVTSVTITPVADDPTATITVNGNPIASGNASAAIALNAGPTVINVVATAQDGVTIRTYSVTVNRAGSSDARLDLYMSPASAFTAVSGSSTVNYTATVASTVTSVTLTPVATHANTTITINGVPVPSGSPSAAISLVTGTTTINIAATAEDGVTVRTYEIAVTRSVSNDAKLSLALNPASKLTVTTGTATVTYAASVSASTTSVNVIPTADEPNATITVNGSAVVSGTPSGAITLSAGTTTVNIVATAQDGVTVRTYAIKITKGGSSDAKLDLKVTPGSALTVVTGTGNLNYATEVGSMVTQVAVTPISGNSFATVTVNGVITPSGTPATVNLTGNTTLITVRSTAEDGTTVRVYTVTVNKAANLISFVQDQFLMEKDPTGKKAAAVTEPDGIKVYPGVSPNGDGINDYLTIEGIDKYPGNTVVLMDKGGVVVYETKDYGKTANLFDGHSSRTGRMLPQGTYFYRIQYKDGSKTVRKTGFIVMKTD